MLSSGDSLITAEPPAEMKVPAMEKAEGLGVNVWPATVTENQ